MSLLSISIRPAVNGYIVAASFSNAATQGGLPTPNTVTEALFTSLGDIGTFLTQQQFNPLPAIPLPA